eukprot:4767643-Pleurochrysis_carterae.AAC.1
MSVHCQVAGFLLGVSTTVDATASKRVHPSVMLNCPPSVEVQGTCDEESFVAEKKVGPSFRGMASSTDVAVSVKSKSLTLAPAARIAYTNTIYEAGVAADINHRVIKHSTAHTDQFITLRASLCTHLPSISRPKY